uniref:Transmembrane protein n=1 Tax=Caenorhabditis japonica TaxID=281687 RepID=A0A8R1ISE8_CAEJA
MQWAKHEPVTAAQDCAAGLFKTKIFQSVIHSLQEQINQQNRDRATSTIHSQIILKLASKIQCTQQTSIVTKNKSPTVNNQTDIKMDTKMDIKEADDGNRGYRGRGSSHHHPTLNVLYDPACMPNGNNINVVQEKTRNHERRPTSPNSSRKIAKNLLFIGMIFALASSCSAWVRLLRPSTTTVRIRQDMHWLHQQNQPRASQLLLEM